MTIGGTTCGVEACLSQSNHQMAHPLHVHNSTVLSAHNVTLAPCLMSHPAPDSSAKLLWPAMTSPDPPRRTKQENTPGNRLGKSLTSPHSRCLRGSDSQANGLCMRPAACGWPGTQGSLVWSHLGEPTEAGGYVSYDNGGDYSEDSCMFKRILAAG